MILQKSNSQIMNKPSQYLIDKTENEQISKFLKQQINKSNIKLMNAKTKTFQHLNTLTPYSDVVNPFEHSVLETEVKTHKEEPKVFTKPPQASVQITEAQKVLKESEQKQHKIVNDMAGILNLDKIEHDLTGIRISQKREAQFIRDQIYFRPTQFEIDKKNEQQHKFITEEYTTEEGLDFMDNRVPKRIVELEKLQDKIFEGKKHSHKNLAASKLQSSTLQPEVQPGNGVIVQDPALISKPKIEVKEEIDALDVNLHHPILKTVTKELLHQAHVLSPTKVQFIQGKCICDCHTDPKFEGRVCLKCMCKHESQNKQQQQQQFGNRVNNFNLLQDVNIPMYKQQQQSIMRYEGEITQGVMNQMIDEQLAHISPNKQIQAVSDQVCNMSNKMWSVALRSDVSPHMTVEEMQNMLNRPSNLGLQIEKEFTLKDQYDVIKKSYQDIVEIQKVKDKKINDLNGKAVNKEIEQQMQKTSRNVTMDQIVAMRKKNNDTLLSVVRESTGPVEPLANSLVKHEYLHEKLEKQDKRQNEAPQDADQLPKRINYLNHQDGADTQVAALRSFTSPFRKPPGCLQMIDGPQNQEQKSNNLPPKQQTNDVPIIETSLKQDTNELGITLGAFGGDTNALSFIPLSPMGPRQSGARANSPIHRKDIISRQNQEMRMRLSNIQSRVHSPARRQIINDARIEQMMEQKRIDTQERLMKLVQETNMNKDEIRDMMRKTHKRLVQIDKRATKNAKTVSPIDFKVLYGRKHGFDQ